MLEYLPVCRNNATSLKVISLGTLQENCIGMNISVLWLHLLVDWIP